MDTSYLFSLGVSNELREKETYRKRLFKMLLGKIYLLDSTEYYLSPITKIAQPNGFGKLKVYNLCLKFY